MDKQDVWSAVSFICAAYAFVGLALGVGSFYTGNWVLIVLAWTAWILNLALLRHANKQW